MRPIQYHPVKPNQNLNYICMELYGLHTVWISMHSNYTINSFHPGPERVQQIIITPFEAVGQMVGATSIPFVDGEIHPISD